MTQAVKVLVPTGAIGYTPFHQATFEAGLRLEPGVIVADSGSPDCGPLYVATTKHYGSPVATRADVSRIVLAARRLGVPAILGSANGFGNSQDVDVFRQLVRDVADEHGLKLRLAAIYSDVDKAYLKARIQQGEPIQPLGAPHALSVAEVEKSTVICAQMGPEPIVNALDAGADVIIAGRACDDAIVAAFPIWKGCDAGLALHMGKIAECGAACTDAHSIDQSIMGVVCDDYFHIHAPGAGRKVSREAVIEHVLYEREEPFHQPGPGGVNDVSQSQYSQVDAATVEVKGSRWIPSDRYLVRLEGAGFVGFRAIGIVGIRDPYLIASLDEIEAGIPELCRQAYPEWNSPQAYHVAIHVYGRDGVLGPREPRRPSLPHEVCLVTEVVAQTQEVASELCAFIDHKLLFQTYEGMKATAGGLAHLGNTEVLPAGPSYQFTVDHLLPLKDPLELFKVEFEECAPAARRLV